MGRSRLPLPVFPASCLYACFSSGYYLRLQTRCRRCGRGRGRLTAEVFFFCFTECFVGAYGLTWMSSHVEILESIKLAH